ncbi:MAG: hypothetical protein Q7J34_10720 [Bacteroidales bacterium]|nr:hypothetical protein [Bacteroidales bacterium]
MTLGNNFLHNEPKFIKITRRRLVVGILIGLGYSFAFYSFLYLIREVFRVLSVTVTYDIWILTDNEVYFYNLFFAFVSAILSQSVCFTFWVDRPKQIFGKQNLRKTSIVNDQRVLNWYFLSWFSKLAVAFGILFGLACKSSFYTFSLYPDYNYIFILIVIVLFLQTWNTMRLTFIRKSLKWMLFSTVIVSVVALCLSRVNLVDYKAINNNYLQKNIYHKYNLELPETDNYERLWNSSLIENIYVVKTKEQQSDSGFVIVFDNVRIPLEKLHEKIRDWQSMRDEGQISNMVYLLHIHKMVKMNFVNQIKNELSKSGVRRINYAVIPNNPEYDKRYYRDFSFPTRIANQNSDWIKPLGIYNGMSKHQNIIEIKQTDPGKNYINKSIVESNQICQTIKILIQRNPDYVIKFYINDSVNFSDYFNVLSSSDEAVHELRNEYSEMNYSRQFYGRDSEKQEEISDKYPLRIIELTTEIIKTAENK